ncbi:MAG: hypothetical protein IM466_03045 [Microcystis sp. M04BS1]|nr:hypothetical protein [Microcystis sp. M04BS1]
MRKLLILLGVIFFSEGINATPFQGREIYRTDDQRGFFIVLTGQPLTMAEVAGTARIRTNTLRKADNCGVGRVKIPEATPAPILRIDDGNPINYLSLPTINNYDCSEGELGNNAYNPATRTVYIANLEPQGEFISRIQREEVKKVALNNCGWGLVFMAAGDGPLYFKGQQYRYFDLLRTVRPPVCRKINGAYITYFAIPLGQ